MVAFQVERAAGKAGELINQSGFDHVLEAQQVKLAPSHPTSTMSRIGPVL